MNHCYGCCFSICLIDMWFFWLLINVRYPVFHKLQGWQSLLQHRVQGEFHGRWDGRRWTHDISSCTSEHLTFGQWSNFPTDPLSENQQQLDMVVSEVLSEVNKLQPWMWSCLRSCCLKILFVRRWWIYLTYWFLCFAYLDPQIFWRTPKNDGTSGHIIILIGDGRVRVRVWTWVWLFGPHFQWLSDVRRFCYYHVCRVYKTGGNRSGFTGYRSKRSGPVPVWTGPKPAQIQNSNLNSKKWKILKKFLKILQDATNLMVSNFLKNSFI